MAGYPEIFNLIKSRRSIGKVKPDPVPKEMITKILEAGIWAPNHYHTEPWKFFVLTEAARNQLGEVLADIYIESLGKADLSEEEQQKVDLQKQKPLRAPVIIAVAAIPSDKPKALPREDLAAACSAVQNMLLAAHALGLGAIWRTGESTYHPMMKGFFNLSEEDEMIGFIYLGYPDIPAKEGKRIPVEEKTEWMNGAE